MWYFVEKNGKAIKGYKSLKKALHYAQTRVRFNVFTDRLIVVSQSGEIFLDW